MKTHQRWVWASVLVAALTAAGLSAEELATVKAGRINVRGQASLSGEVVTQLQQGDTVTVLEDITLKNPKKGEPAKWVKIALPANTPVWVFSPFIDSDKRVKVKQLNVRAGPGENHDVLGRIERGAEVKEIRQVDSWMEIEPPPGVYAFVSVDLLDRAPATAVAAVTPAPSTVPSETTAAATPATTPLPPSEPPTTVETVMTEPPPAAAQEPGTGPGATQEEPVASVPVINAPMVESKPPEVVPPPPGPRVVTREGKVVVSFSIQSPTAYGLESLDTFRLIYFLSSEDAAIQLKKYAGRRVIVSGEEFMDEVK